MKDKCPQCGQPLEFRLQFHPDACCVSYKAGIEEGIKRNLIAARKKLGKMAFLLDEEIGK